MVSPKLCRWNAIFLVPWVLYSLLESHNPFDIWESTPTIAHNSCCHVSEPTRHTREDVCVLFPCMILSPAGSCWSGAMLTASRVHMRASVWVYTHMWSHRQWQRGRDAEREGWREVRAWRWEDGRWGEAVGPACRFVCDECGSACAIWCPSVMVDGLWASGSFCVVDITQQHTLDMMFADSSSHCCYNEPCVVRAGSENRKVLEESDGVLHSVALFVQCVWGLWSVIKVWEHVQIKADFKKKRHFDFVLQKTFWSLSYEKTNWSRGSVWIFTTARIIMSPVQRSAVTLRFSMSWNFSVLAPTEQPGGQKVRKQTK